MSVFCGFSYSRLQPTAQTSVEGMGPLKEHRVAVVWWCILIVSCYTFLCFFSPVENQLLLQLVRSVHTNLLALGFTMSHPDFRESCPCVLVSLQFVLNMSCIISVFSRVQECGEYGVWQVVGRREGLKGLLFPLLVISDLSAQWCQVAVTG